MSTLRDPNRHAVMCYTSLETLAKVRTVIAGRVVKHKVAAKKSQPKTVRPMGFADFFIESVEQRVADVTPSKEAVEWSRKQLAKHKADRQVVEKISRSDSEKDRQNSFQMKVYFEDRIKKEEDVLKKMRKSKRKNEDEISAQERKLADVREKYRKYAEACLKYADRRKRSSGNA